MTFSRTFKVFRAVFSHEKAFALSSPFLDKVEIDSGSFSVFDITSAIAIGFIGRGNGAIQIHRHKTDQWIAKCDRASDLAT